MGNGFGISKDAQQRINKSKHKQKVIDFINNYGFKHGTELEEWCEQNVSENYKSITINNYSKQPSVRDNRDELVSALNKAWQSDWRFYLLTFTDVVDIQKNQVVQSMIKWTCPKSGEYNKYAEIYYQFDAIFNKASGLWLRSAYKQFVPGKSLFKQYPHFEAIGKTRPIKNIVAGSKPSSSRPSTSYQSPSSNYESPSSNYQSSSSNYGTSSTSNNDQLQKIKKRDQQSAKRNKEESERWQRDRKKREQEQRRRQEQRRQDERRRQQQRQAEQSRRRNEQQARQREQRYREQQRQHQQNMRRQEQAQRDYQNQQRQIAQQRYRQAQQAQMKRNNARY